MTVPVPDQLEFISVADGVTRDFPYPKRFMQADEIKVLLRDASGVDTPQYLGQHFSIAGSSWPNGGAVSFYIAPPSGLSVVRYRATQAKQTVSLANNQRNDAASVELQLDRLTMSLQDGQSDIARALKFPAGVTPTDIQPLPLPERGKALVGNADGTGYLNAALEEGDIAASVEEANLARDVSVAAKTVSVNAAEASTAEANRSMQERNASEAAALISENAKNAAVSAATSLHNYDTLAQANADLANIPDNGGVNILADGIRNGFYVKQGGVLVKKSSSTLPALDNRTGELEHTAGRLSRAADVIDPSKEYAHVLQDMDGFFSTYFRDDGAMRNVFGKQDILGLVIVQDDNPAVTFTDEMGFVILTIGGEGIEADDGPTSIIPQTSGLLCGVSGVRSRIYLPSIVTARSDAGKLEVSLISKSTGEGASSDTCLDFYPEELGDAATLTMRPIHWDGLTRAELNLTIKVAANPAIAPQSTNVLMIGDSVLNYEQPKRIKALLEGWGYLPNFIGTILSSGDRGSTLDITGPLAEARSGWQLRHYTNNVTGKTPLPIGGEQAYLAGSKAYKSDRNPFLRPASGGDDPAIVRNGYVLDFSSAPSGYQGRFGLGTPNIIIVEAFLNDVNNLTSSNVYSEMLENEKLFLSRIRAGQPNAKILRIIPNCARDGGANDVMWSTRFVPALAAIRAAHAELADSNINLIATWQHMAIDAGYKLASGAVDPATGTTISIVDDRLHPIDGVLQQLASATASAIACALDGKI